MAFALLSAAGCNIINPEETAPSYIEVTGFQFNPTPTSVEMGSSSSTKIKDVWVYVDNQFQGVYELPARFPVLKTGLSACYLPPAFTRMEIGRAHV